jgi:folate-binding protein YgfZ
LITYPVCTLVVIGDMLARMNHASFYVLNDISVVDIFGADAPMIVNNLTTHEVVPVALASGRETFVTDVRGKTLGHVVLFKQSEAIRMLGPAGQSDAIAQHIDRYTIREDAMPQIRDSEFSAIVLSRQAAAVALLQMDDGESIAAEPIAQLNVRLAERDIAAYRTRWLGEGTIVLLVTKADLGSTEQALADLHLVSATESDFHNSRIEAGFPWYGIDLDDSNLPQELDRDAEAISFTKGCYLGQETVARLDALGQVQRRVVRWKIEGACPPPGTTLMADEKKVGRLTSIAQLPGGDTVALGFARRSHFEPGSLAKGTDPDSGVEFTGTVL